MKATVQTLLFLSLGALSLPAVPGEASDIPRRDALIFHASFEGGADAKVAAGDARIYTAPPSRNLEEGKPGLNPAEVTIARGRGRYGDAIEFLKKTKNMVFYRAEKNMGYRKEGWSGTVSFWLSLDPAALEQEFSDPIQITDKKYDDAALWVDFTKDDVPPHFRLGVFADTDVWRPKDGKQDIPESEQPVVRVTKPSFSRERWTHVAITFSDLNREGTGAIARLYLDGKLQGAVKDRRQVFTWNEAKATMRVGLGYVGLFDDLAVFNRALSEKEIQELYQLPGGVGSLK